MEKLSAALRLHEREEETARIMVRTARNNYREEIVCAGLDPMDPKYRDALSSDEDSDASTVSSESDAESDATQ